MHELPLFEKNFECLRKYDEKELSEQKLKVVHTSTLLPETMSAGKH